MAAGQSNNDFIYGGFDMFRNYDGANGSFGDTSIRATNSDPANTSVYASVDAGNAARMVVVASTRPTATRPRGSPSPTPRSSTPRRCTADQRQLGAAAQLPDINITLTNAFQYSMPANSVTTLVLVP